MDESIHATGLLFKVGGDGQGVKESLDWNLFTNFLVDWIFSQVVPEILLPKNSEKAKKTWKSLCKKKKTNWNPKDHELFGKLDLWLRFHFVYYFFAWILCHLNSSPIEFFVNWILCHLNSLSIAGSGSQRHLLGFWAETPFSMFGMSSSCTTGPRWTSSSWSSWIAIIMIIIVMVVGINPS